MWKLKFMLFVMAFNDTHTYEHMLSAGRVCGGRESPTSKAVAGNEAGFA